MSPINQQKEIFICRSTGCNSSNAKEIHEELDKLIQIKKLSDKVHIKTTGCHGFCQMGPILVVYPGNIMYVQVTKDDMKEVIDEHIINDKIVERLLYKDPKTGKYIQKRDEIPFYIAQQPIIKKNCGEINPEIIDEYIAIGGYKAIEKILGKLKPLEVIQEIFKSRLRGRGGGGFSTGRKWLFCFDAIETPKYIICNADEGDPGAFMDRSILESDPHSVIEGMIIGGYSIGSSQGYFYVRAEYPLAIERLKIAIKQAKEKGFLGKNILNSDFDFDIKIVEGAGAFVCGEETALLESIMGKRGMPRPRPPFPANKGLWGQPTVINNVKTFATVPQIINNGAEWFSSIGTKDASGTIVFALTGNINNAGLVEINMGTTLRKLIYDIGGGIPNGKKLKAVQIGGPSGGCIPELLIDVKMDYKTLTSLGAIMGSGGIIVLDEDTCMVELAHYFISFTQKESCGKCPPCRIGTKIMLDILTRIKDGQGREEDLIELERLANVVKKTSLCGLGQTAPNPVLTTIRYFRAEYQTHITLKSCPSMVCKAFIDYHVDEEKCTGCGLCKTNCPVKAVEGEKKTPHSIITDLCIKCGLCYSSCPVNAISKIHREVAE